MHVMFNALQANNRSGTGRYAFEVLRALCEVVSDHEVSAILPQEMLESFPATQQFSPIGVETNPVHRIIFERLRLSRLAKQKGAELVHFPANFGRSIKNANVVLTVHDLSFLRHPEWFRADRAAYYRYSIRHSVRAASRIIADSHATAHDLQELLNVEASKIDVIPLGVSEAFRPVSLDEIAEARQRYSLPERFVLYTGTHEPRKNLVRLVEAWSRVVNKIEMDLVLAGRHGWKNDALEQAIERSPYQARIHRPGYIDQKDLPALLSSADIFAFPSLFEGFGLPPLEAMACGTPVLTSNTSSLPEVTDEAAVLVDPQSTESIAAGLVSAVENSERLSTSGTERAAQFTWQRCAELTLASYKQSLGNRNH